MTKGALYSLLSAATFIAGIIFYGLYTELLVIKYMGRTKSPVELGTAERKTVTFYFWNKSELAQEKKEILISSQPIKTIIHIVTAWLTLLEEEKILPKKVILQTVLLDKSETEAYLSFDRSPLIKSLSVHDKLMFLNSLLKTLADAGLNLTLARFLVQHSPLNDNHLDFTHAWPISGYIP